MNSLMSDQYSCFTLQYPSGLRGQHPRYSAEIISSTTSILPPFKTSSKTWRIRALFFSVVIRILLEGGVMVCSHVDISTVSVHPPEVLQ